MGCSKATGVDPAATSAGARAQVDRTPESNRGPAANRAILGLEDERFIRENPGRPYRHGIRPMEGLGECRHNGSANDGDRDDHSLGPSTPLSTDGQPFQLGSSQCSQSSFQRRFGHCCLRLCLSVARVLSTTARAPFRRKTTSSLSNCSSGLFGTGTTLRAPGTILASFTCAQIASSLRSEASRWVRDTVTEIRDQI